MEKKTEAVEVIDPVETTETALTRVEKGSLIVDREPEIVLLEAKKAAKALMSVVEQKPKKVILNNEQYLEFESWQLLGRFYGITVKEDGDPEFVQLGSVCGFKASAVALKGELVISRATAYCLNDEEKWSSRPKYEWGYCLKGGGWSVEDPGTEKMIWEENPDKPGKKRPKKERRQTGEEKVPLFQLASMAQTRAGAKAFRNVLSWVAEIAGYRPTPAEEIIDISAVKVTHKNTEHEVERREDRVLNQDHGPEEAPWPEDVIDTPQTNRSEFLPPPAGYTGPAKPPERNGQIKNAVPLEKGDASTKQLSYIREICRKLKLDPDEESREQLGKRLNELSVKDASELISYLKGVGF